MPTPAEILAGTEVIARENVAFALLWHVVLACAVLALILRFRPSRRFAGVALAAPLASVSVAAWTYGNPFNGLVMALLAVILAGIGASLAPTPVTPGPRWQRAAGAAMIAFGWGYPHFLAPGTTWAYLVAAPVGLVPCPTLSVVVGFALLGRGLRSRAWAGVLAGAALFYGIFGMLRLGVWLDVGLLAGAVALAVVALRRPARRGAGGQPLSPAAAGRGSAA